MFLVNIPFQNGSTRKFRSKQSVGASKSPDLFGVRAQNVRTVLVFSSQTSSSAGAGAEATVRFSTRSLRCSTGAPWSVGTKHEESAVLRSRPEAIRQVFRPDTLLQQCSLAELPLGEEQQTTRARSAGVFIGEYRYDMLRRRRVKGVVLFRWKVIWGGGSPVFRCCL